MVSNSGKAGGDQIEFLTTLEGNDKIGEFWAACHPSRDADPDFFHFLVNSRPETARQQILVVRVGDEPKALLIGRVERMRTPIKVGYFRLPTPELRTLIISYGGWLGEIDEPRAILIVDALRRLLAKGEADAVMFHFPEFASPLTQQALKRPAYVCRDYLPVLETHRIIDLPSDGTGFIASLSSNSRYQQRKRSRKLSDDFGAVRIDALHSLEDVGTLVRACEAVALKSYQHGIGVGFSANDDVLSRLEFQARAGWLRGFVLFLDNKPCAFWIGALRHGVFSSDYLAFDPAFEQYAPGMYLIVEVIEILAKDGADPARQIDFGLGDSIYKQRLSNRAIEEAMVFIFAPNFRALSVNLLRSSVGRINLILKSQLNSNAWLAGAKRTLRSCFSSAGRA